MSIYIHYLVIAVIWCIRLRSRTHMLTYLRECKKRFCEHDSPGGRECISRSLRTPSEEFGKNCQYFRGSSLQPRELRFGHGSWCLSTRTQSLLFLKLRFVGSYSTLNHDLSRRKKSSRERNKLNLSIASGQSLKYSSVIGVEVYVMETWSKLFRKIIWARFHRLKPRFLDFSMKFETQRINQKSRFEAVESCSDYFSEQFWSCFDHINLHTDQGWVFQALAWCNREIELVPLSGRFFGSAQIMV